MPTNASTSLSNTNVDITNKRLLSDLELDLGIGTWEGKAVFSSEPASTLPKPRKEKRRPKAPETPRSEPSSQSGSGSALSPISISSASPSPSPQLPRPRAIPHYSSPLPRTAYTPPRALIPPASQEVGSASGSFPSSSQYRSNSGPSKPIHPFFTRARTLPPPSQQPRYIAHYSSTEASQSSQSQFEDSQGQTINSQSTSTSGSRVPTPVPQNSSTHASETHPGETRAEIDQLADRVGELFMSERPSTRRPLAPAATLPVKGKGKIVIETPIVFEKEQIDPKTSLPILHYATYPSPPKIAYTANIEEANDLLSCLRGPVLGFDLEWPPAGFYNVPIPGGGNKRKPVGMIWNDAKQKYDFGQGRTALMQFCDERLVVLIHLGENMDVPSKAIEIIRDPKIYKMGVQVKGDGLKLLRDFPNHFVTPRRSKPPSPTTGQSQLPSVDRASSPLTSDDSESRTQPKTKPDLPTNLSPSGLLELSFLARAVDPIGTGPGSTLISLARLTERYTGKILAKPQKIRAGNWLGPLGKEAIDYAANDVWAAIQIYKALQLMAKEQDFTPNLDLYCSHVGTHIVRPKPLPVSSTSGEVPGGQSVATRSGTVELEIGEKMITLPEGTKLPGPAMLSALSDFVGGETTVAMAERKGVKLSTVEGYICQAILAVGIDNIGKVDKERVYDQIPTDSYTWKRYPGMYKDLRKEHDGASGSASGSESEEVEKLE